MSPRIRTLLLTSSALLALGTVPGAAGPDGPAVVGGAASVSGAGTSSVIVNQSSDRAIINWNTFNLGTGESARFNQPNSSSIIAQPRHRRARRLDHRRHALRQRPRLHHQPRRHPVRPQRHHQHRELPRHHPRHPQRRLHGRADELQHPGPLRRLDRQPRPHHRARPAASPRWWRRACATPAPSRRRSARSRSPRATCSRSTCTATS